MSGRTGYEVALLKRRFFVSIFYERLRCDSRESCVSRGSDGRAAWGRGW